MALNPQHLTVSHLLEGRLFQIPDYQRSYSWKKSQRDDLFNDICEAYRSQNDHFMATVVALAQPKPVMIGASEFRVVDLVDGQQRITTLVILLKAIEKALREDDPAEHTEKNSLADLLVKRDEHSLVLLQTNHDSSNLFTDYIRTGFADAEKAATAADHNVIDAIKESEVFVQSWRERSENDQAVPMIGLLATVRNRMSMIFHEITDQAVVYRVFEVLNSRGLDVKWVDKLKSQLMASLFEYVPSDTREGALKEMQNIWGNIYRLIGTESDSADEALKFAGTLAQEKTPHRILSEKDAVSEILNSAGQALNTIIAAARKLEDVNVLVHKLRSDNRLNAPAKVVHARFVALAIQLRKFDKKIANDLMGRWERVSFRLFGIARLDARSLVREYVELGHDIIWNELTAKEIAERLDELDADYDIDDAMSGKTYWDEWYGRREDTRYVLFRYEEYLAAEAGQKINVAEWNKIWALDPNKSIEHVTPQRDEAEYTHNLGNLTMLPPGVNSTLGANSPQEKAQTYIQCGLKITASIGRTIEGGVNWNKGAVTARRKTLEAFIRKYWEV